MDAADLTRSPAPAPLLREEVLIDPGIEAGLPRSEWDAVFVLRRGGMTDAGLYRLLRLRTTYRRHADAATDGLASDPHAQFARWLVAQGRLHEGA